MSQPIVLVADDELFFRNLFAEALSEDSYRVETVDSGTAAVERLRQGGVDLVVTDLVMPGVDGLEVLRQARALDNPPEVILATGNATLETAILALKNGARDYLTKPFSPEELRHLVHKCLDQRRLLDENSILKQQIRLYQKGQDIASLIELERLLERSISTLCQEIGGGRGFAFLTDGKESKKVFATRNVDRAEAESLAEHLVDIAIDRSGLQTLEKEDIPESSNLPADLRTIFVYPLKCDATTKGALVVCNQQGLDCGDAPHGNLQFLGDQTCIGFANALHYQGARELIYTDDLTGLYNLRYLDIALDQEIRRSERYGLEFSLVFFDIDNFKTINDTHGHLAGSSALQEVSELLRKSIREVDVPFRYGGDEFTALLVETGTQGARVVAERIRTSIESYLFLANSDKKSRITATVGYATFPHHAKDKTGILNMADRAMYEGKKQRNVTRSPEEVKS
ncbi:MAG: diguanylate cyclase response regulator [Desulfuromonas sp.]|nr:MAG: diguanylate cyclase response regulator [Desulfuromonas sp.]